MTGFICLTTISIFLLAGFSETVAFIPRICANNATTSLGICCPVPPDFVEPCGGEGRGRWVEIPESRIQFFPAPEILMNDDRIDWPRRFFKYECSCEDFVEPCGGEGRGRCVEIPESRIQFFPAPEILMNDDRIDWPRRFFKYECSCEGNYMGYMCHECRFGFRGNNCMERYTRIRKDVRTLTTEDKLKYRDVVSQSKHVPSDYVALGNVYDIDPITSPTFVNVNVHDSISYLHAYASRNTITNGSNTVCTGTEHAVPAFDPAHGGPAFPPWHRLMLLVYERELQKISGEDDFTIPYYNWTAGPEAYKYVCNNDLMGATNYSDPLGRLDRESVFYSWYGFCQESDEMKGCKACNASRRGKPLRRTPGGADHSISLPSPEDEEFAINRPLYDSPPYDRTASGALSFRNDMEGFTSRNGEGIYLHNRAHFFHQGTLLAVPTAANDPLFMLLHAFTDKHFEIWLRKNPTPTTQMPERGAALGHNREDPLVGFFPRHISSWYVTSSTVFGYDFDDMIAENKNDTGMGHSGWIITTVLAVVIVILLVVVIILIVKYRAAKQQRRESVTPPEATRSIGSSDEKSPLL